MNVELTVSERQHLRQLQKQRRDDEGYVKVTVVLMLDAGRGLATVAQDLGLDETTVYRYVRAFTDLGLEKYLAHEQPGYWGLLCSAQLAHLCREVNTTLYTDCKAIQAWLLRTYQVTYSLSGLTDLLHRLGFTYKLTTPVPCQADAAAQADFLDELVVLEAHVERGEAVLYYADAAHPTHNTRCTRAWCAVGQERPLLTVSGRERVNLNAALNAYEPTQVVLDETACVNAQSTRRLYEQLLAAHPDKARIYVVCDNARYYKNKELRVWLADKPICQVFLPPYSPNLNLIERFWKYLRQKIINSTFYRTKGQFKKAVLNFFDRLPEFGQDLTSLLTRKYHILDAQPSS
ncbi:IS630 family transposase [Hymenobacter nivis]|jgi:transposase|uniref:IS630 family transposase n=1 Tax=Hymenobacter nivis TaxID=1850093 RepID=A0A2Z3GKL0_9BACT|nr:IS630 family transposase [Hymenobacter nivis]AWM31455.1 IS630 family transposase [Hymenobacter nivis]AWM32753.1 IS630 family transposase [Hymenobacter nivis]